MGYTLSPIMTAIKVAIGVTGVIGNLLVVVVMYKYKKLFMQVKSAYIINQSFIDGLASAVLILLSLLRPYLVLDMDSVLAEVYCRIGMTQLPLWGLMASSSFNLMAISAERYLAVVHPLWYRTRFTDRKSRVSIVFIWIFGISYVALYEVHSSGITHGECVPLYRWPSVAAARAVGMVQIFVALIIDHAYCRPFRVLRSNPEDTANAHSPERGREHIYTTLYN